MTILLVAGEASGDARGAELAVALRRRDPTVRLLGAGGEAMRAAGVELLHPLTRLAAVGIADVLRRLPAYHHAMRRLEACLDAQRPDAVILIDFPGFNLRLAPRVKRRGIRLIYYISPQLWAWKPERMRIIRRTVDRMLVILPFEEPLYREAGVPVAFVGHPLLDTPPPTEPPHDVRRRLGIPTDQPLITLLPGSRRQEIAVHWPILRRAAVRIVEQIGVARFALIEAPASSARWLSLGMEATPGALLRCSAAPKERRRAPAHWPWPSQRCGPLTIVHGDDARRHAVAAADLALVCSGTATLEAGILGCPMVIFYRTGWFNWLIFRPLVRIPSIGLVNIVAGRRIVPELIQHDLTPERLADEAVRLLRDATARAAMRQKLEQARGQLGTPGAADRAAAIILGKS